MESLPQGLVPARRRWGAAIAVALSCAGCETIGPFTMQRVAMPAPSANCCQAAVTWSNKVLAAPDVVNGGSPIPGLVGRLYLFGPTIDYPMIADGSVTIDLFDDSAPQPQTQPLERWHIDADTLKRLAKKDMIGWGYTLFLPWSSCKREITRVHLTVRFDPASGSPIYSPSGPLTLEHPGSPPVHGGPEVPPGTPPIAPPAAPVPPVRQAAS